MSNRVASTSPCTSSGCGCTRYQIDKAVTKAITEPTRIDGSQVGAGGGCLATSTGGSGACIWASGCVWASGFGISIAHSARLKAACRNQISWAPHNCERMCRAVSITLAAPREQGRRDVSANSLLRAALVTKTPPKPDPTISQPDPYGSLAMCLTPGRRAPNGPFRADLELPSHPRIQCMKWRHRIDL